ncbi:Transcription factor E2F8 [Brachionus plicatilis]|uniref:Transcription factor E2F8 n=1 Tax=Brachionus plicatilis TaxID=10195 RepID=A0A3M7RVG7_BRAPC|nr:Transcription factor E2F8 [Brachionus plicatilis]
MQNTRREKSLSLLCQKFLSFYPVRVEPHQRIIICLDHMAQLLEVERRRIYDIVNVLESVEILSRFCKNQYLWHGFSHIPHTLSKLKTLSVKSSFLEYTKALMASQLENSIDLYQDQKQALNVCFDTNYAPSVKLSFSDMRDATTQTISISREEKSLGIMSQKFLMLFLTSEDGLVSINFAARVLLGDTKSDTTELGKFKTKIRRLYDIANVLTSIGLIKKYNINDVNISKPAYKYTGPNVDVIRDAEYVFDFMNSGNPLSNSKHSLFDHFKRNLDLECNIPKFDVNTGILTSKDKKWKKQANAKGLNSPNNRYNPYPVMQSNSHQLIDGYMYDCAVYPNGCELTLPTSSFPQEIGAGHSDFFYNLSENMPLSSSSSSSSANQMEAYSFNQSYTNAQIDSNFVFYDDSKYVYNMQYAEPMVDQLQCGKTSAEFCPNVLPSFSSFLN